MCMCSIFTSIIHLQTALSSFNVVVHVPVFVIKLGAITPHPKAVLWIHKYKDRSICKLVA